MHDSDSVCESLPSAAAGEPCRICGGPLVPAFSGTVLGDIAVTYYTCGGCHSLILPQPRWLERAYGPLAVPDPDYGLLQRALFVHATLRRLRSVGLLADGCRILDHGAGKGVLVRLLLDQAFDAWGYEPIATPMLAAERIGREWPTTQFDLITSIEVAEHLLDPVATLKRLRAVLAARGILLLSTELFDYRRHDASWRYLAQEHGQHITLFSHAGLEMAARKAGLQWVTSLRFGGVDFLHLLTHQNHRLSTWRLLHLRWRQYRGKRRARRDRCA